MRSSEDRIRGAWRADRDRRDGDFRPVAVRMVDVDRPVDDLTAPDARYEDALLVVRLHDDPLGMTRIALRRGHARAADITAAVTADLRDEIRAHARRYGCLPADGAGACPGARLDESDLPRVDIIVPTAGRPQSIATCLRSLQRLAYPDFRVFVVDNRPDPATRAAVDELGDPRLHYVAEPRPGSSVARNRGIAESSAEILAFTDDDVTVDPNWLSWVVGAFRSDPQVTVVTGLVLPTDLDTPAKLRFEEEQLGFGKGFRRRVFDLGPNRPSEIPFFPWGAAFGSGNNMAFRRGQLIALGGFDPALGAGSRALAGADIEAFTHALLRGGRLVYEPRALCWHDHRSEDAALRRQLFNYRVGSTAILTKWMLRRPWQLSAAILRAVPAATGRGVADGRPQPGEIERLHRQLRSGMQRSMLGLQLKGYLLGPLMYVRSVAWARRLRLHAALRPVHVSVSAVAAPAALRTLDLDQPLEDVVLEGSSLSYRSLIGIPRRGARPLGSTVLPVGPDQRVPASALEAVRAQFVAAPVAPSPNSEQPPVTVVVPTCSDVSRLERSLPSILDSDYDRFEVVLVENRPQSGATRAWAAERFGDDDRLRYVEEPRPGAARARNRGLAEASGDIVAFVDDDVVVDRLWLQLAAAAFATGDEVGCVTGLILPAHLDAPQLVFEQFSSFAKGFERQRFSLPETREVNRLFPYTAGYIGSGANTMLRTDLARRLGGFDTRLGPATPSRGGAELDLYIRVLRSGAHILYEPAVIVWHEHPKDLSDLDQYAFRLGVGLGAMLTKQLIEGPERLRFLTLAPQGIHYVLHPGSRKNALKTAEFPRRLDAIERLGMVLGPPAYLASVVAHARSSRAGNPCGRGRPGRARAGRAAA